MAASRPAHPQCILNIHQLHHAEAEILLPIPSIFAANESAPHPMSTDPLSNNAFNRRQFLKIVGIATAITSLVMGILYYIASAYVLQQAEHNIENLLLSHKGIHQYVQKIMHPSLFQHKKEGGMSPDFYAPELFSSSFIVRNQHEFYNQERMAMGLPALYYKMAATNPRNPINRADATEEKLIRMFNERRTVKNYREVVRLNGKKYLYVALPFLENDKKCLVCHGKREDAPPQLQELYPGNGGFNEKISDIRAIISIRAPLEREFFTVYIVCGALLMGVLVILGLFLFTNRLQLLVRRRTASLEAEIDERRQIEAALKASEAFLSSVIENIPDMVFIKEAKELRFVRLNRSGENLLGYAQESLLGKNDYDFFPKEQADLFTKYDREALSLQKLCDIPEEQIHTKDKGDRILHTKKIPICDKEGSPLFLLGISEDITERKAVEADQEKLKKQLQQAQRMESIGTLASGIAHDFNNILTPILGYAEMMQEGMTPDNPFFEPLHEVLTASNRAKALVRQILAFSRQADHERISIQPHLVIKEALKLLRSSIPTTIEFRQHIDPQAGYVLADPTQIHQIIMNLCTNAYHAMHDSGGVLTVSLKAVEVGGEDSPSAIDLQPGRYVKLEVSDTGIGIDKMNLDRIFEPYFSTKQKGEGTGLGLSVVHGIVQSLDGLITVESEPKQGTTFHVFLPCAPSAAQANAPPVAGRLQGGSERILIVDDDRPIVDVVTSILLSLGYQVTSTTSSLEALKRFEANPDTFDLVITDMTMPAMNGAELTQRLLKRRGDLPIILCTGFSELINEAEAKALGIRHYLMKPVLKSDLARIIREVLDSPADN